MKSRISLGFTFVEVIVAMTISIFMVVIVYAVTNSMTAMAARQKQSLIAQSKRQRFLEIFRHDLRGWIAIPRKMGEPVAPDSDQTLLVKFDTTADGLSDVVAETGAGVPRSSRKLRYAVQGAEGGYQVLRIETPFEGHPLSLIVLACEQLPKLEFFDGKTWLPAWASPERPQAVRALVDGDSIYCALD